MAGIPQSTGGGLRTAATRRILASNSASLLHFLPCAVAFAGDDVVLERLVLLVLDEQRMALFIDQFHAQLAIAAVLLGVRRVVDHLVLGADGGVDILEDLRHLGGKAGIKPPSAGDLGEGDRKSVV